MKKTEGMKAARKAVGFDTTLDKATLFHLQHMATILAAGILANPSCLKREQADIERILAVCGEAVRFEFT